ncbi:unnamed protein product [Gordionus sp. m RMFG-2023]
MIELNPTGNCEIDTIAVPPMIESSPTGNYEIDTTLAVNVRYSSFFTLKEWLNKYEISNATNYSIHRSKKSKDPILKSTIMYERLYYQCYEGKIRPSKSKGKRQRLSVKKNCLSRISFAKDGPYLKCISIHDIHNHDRDLSLFMASCRQRQLDGDQKSIIHQALKYDGNLTLIHQEMKRKNLNITKRDLYNLKHQYMKNPCSVNDLEDLIKTIKLDITNIVELFEENGIFKALYYQTKKMQDHYLRYPEVVLIDATYNLNSYHLPVFTLGVIDGEENTRIVAIWLVLSDSSTTVKNMCQIFKNYNNVFLKTLTIISDKNFTERAIYQDEFPNAKLEICIFHVLQIFKRQLTTIKYNLTIIQVKKMHVLFRRLIYAETPGIYWKYYYYLKNSKYQKVFLYFDTNWHGIREEFCLAWRNKSVNFDNFTNNRIEGTNRALKRIIKRNSSLHIFYKNLNEYLNCLEDKNKDIILTNSRLNYTSLPPSSPQFLFSKLLTLKAYKRVNLEIKYSFNITYEDFNVSENLCNCGFQQRYLLPCKHIFRYREDNNISLYDDSLCALRWWKEYNLYPYLSENSINYEERDDNIDIEIISKNTKNKCESTDIEIYKMTQEYFQNNIGNFIKELPNDLMIICFQELKETCEKVCNLEYLKSKKRINTLENKENINSLPSSSNSLELVKNLKMPEKINRKKCKIDNEIDLSIMQDITNQENLQLSKENLELPKENLQLSKKNIELPIQDQLQLPKTLSFHKLHSKLL